MNFLAPLALLADASAASTAMRAYVTPVLGTMVAIAGIAVVFFLIYGGIQYMSSAGDPEKLDHAKRIIKNALIGLVLVVAAATLTAILTHAYSGTRGFSSQALPALVPEPESPSTDATDVIIRGITGFIEKMISSGAKPFLDGLKFFTETTPLMADNSSVFNLWLVMVGIADVLFIVVVALLGFQVMSFATFGLEEIEFKHLLPQLGLIFLLVNSSIFAIDAIIGLSNGMIGALRAGLPNANVWASLLEVTLKAGGSIGLAALLIMAAFFILSVMLLVYYVLRLVTLYLGAVLSPVILLIWLIPAFKDFAVTAMKVYITTIFVLFVHVVILGLAASIFTGMAAANPGQPLNPIMSMVVGIATLLALLKTQGVMSQLSYVSLGPKTARKLGGQFTNAVSYMTSKRAMRTAKSAEEQSSHRREIPQGQGIKRIGKSETFVVAGRSAHSGGAQGRKATSGGQTTITAPPSSKTTGQTKRAPKPAQKAKARKQ
jgi:hypothetical protein